MEGAIRGPGLHLTTAGDMSVLLHVNGFLLGELEQQPQEVVTYAQVKQAAGILLRERGPRHLASGFGQGKRLRCAPTLLPCWSRRKHHRGCGSKRNGAHAGAAVAGPHRRTQVLLLAGLQRATAGTG